MTTIYYLLHKRYEQQGILPSHFNIGNDQKRQLSLDQQRDIAQEIKKDLESLPLNKQPKAIEVSKKKAEEESDEEVIVEDVG